MKKEIHDKINELSIFNIDYYVSECVDPSDRHTSLLCKKYPINCHDCIMSWRMKCTVSKQDREYAYNHGRRPYNCPLSLPSVVYTDIQKDDKTCKYYGLTQADWIRHNPIIAKDVLVVAMDLMRMKCGDGERRYVDLPYLITYDIAAVTNEVKHLVDSSFVKCDKLNTPDDVITAYNQLQARATELGYPFKLFSDKRPIHPLMSIDAKLSFLYDPSVPDAILATIDVKDTVENIFYKKKDNNDG